jgi:hypothetical protein
MSFLGTFHGTLATVVLCVLLFAEESGVPLPLVPGDVLLVYAGILIASGGLSPWLLSPWPSPRRPAARFSGTAGRGSSERLDSVPSPGALGWPHGWSASNAAYAAVAQPVSSWLGTGCGRFNPPVRRRRAYPPARARTGLQP